MESTRIPTGLLRPQSPVTWALCAAVSAGNVVMDTAMPTCATGINAQGQLILVIGTAFLDASVEGREQMLRHEAHHVFCNHMQRREDRNPEQWNQVCDAAIHYQTNVDWALIEQEADDLQVVTFDRLGIPPMTPELAYDRLRKLNPPPTDAPAGCGSGSGTGNPMEQQASTVWVTVAQSIANAADVEMEESGEHPFDAAADEAVVPIAVEASPVPPHTRHQGVGLGDGGNGQPYTVVLPEPPAWVEKLLANLSKRRGRRLEGRSYRREHRLGHPLLPGYGRNKRFDGVFMVDASGSIDMDKLIQMLSAVCVTPELREAKVHLFDTFVSPEFSSADTEGIFAQVRRHRGGTRIKAAYRKVGTDRPLIWFTDAQSGDGLPPPNEEDVWVVYGYGDEVEIKRHPNAEGEL